MADLEISIGGRPVPLRVSFAPILDRAGAVEFGIAVLEDVTDERLATTLLAHQAEELARSNAELEQFAYVASHDLSEPLRSVAGFVQLLSQRYKGRLDDDADEFIGFTLEGVRRMQTLIQDLLTYSRVSRLDYERVPVDCNRLMAEALQAETFIHVSELPTVWGDAGQLRSVFQNLVANGLKFKAPGREPELWISAVRHDTSWEFCVADNGIGIAEQHRERVFKMFQRLHSQDDFPGTGMGLSICQRIVQRHGGKIWVENNHDHGSAFRFTLPDRETLP
ncbi:MAG: two-component system, chemotaxis family, sensor kinase Cph1 [Acidimicrobiaceae bacterium]|nr:two-component system, chemotaxis family, sensor kinase Cph1 [Acidimicrobiaceae bacterium]